MLDGRMEMVISQKGRDDAMRRIRTGFLLSVVVMLWGGSAAASGLGIGARYTFVRSPETHKNTNMLGVLGRLRGGAVGVEAAVDYRKDDMGGGASVKAWPVTATLLVYPFQPIYGLAGLGWYNATLKYPSGMSTVSKTTTRMGYHLGAGIEFPFSSGMSVTGEFRYVFLDYKFEDIPGEIGKRKADAFTLGAAIVFNLK
jgi:opacity protein-like surface antigen